MNTDLARWQFATTSIYHFLFVPVTIGLAFLVALLQTTWYRRDSPEFRRLTKFFGTLLLINVAIGTVTGLVQEFEFGMNWSNYSRLVGNVFGGPLAMEGLAAFFLESTFLGIWIFGWDKLSRGLHLACIWIVAAAAMLSAAFIMAANSWMQHPVGYVLNSQNQPVLNNVWALFTNPVFLLSYPHVILASLVTGAVIMLAVSAWQLRRARAVAAFRRTAVISLVVLAPAVLINMFIGSELGVIEGTYQPMKIAAAEALWTTCPSHCSFSMLQVGGGKNDETPTKLIQVPDLLSILATNHVDGEVQGMNNLQAQYAVAVRPGQLHPECVPAVLGDAGDGVSGHADRAGVGVGFVVDPPEDAAQGEGVSVCGAVAGDHPVPGEHRRVGVDRERPAAVDRAGFDDHGAGGVPVGDHHRHLDQPDRVRPAVRRLGGRRTCI